MTELRDDDVLELLRRTMPLEQAAVASDLWPRVRRRIDQGHTAPPIAEWVLMAALALLCLLQPSLLGIVLLHF